MWALYFKKRKCFYKVFKEGVILVLCTSNTLYVYDIKISVLQLCICVIGHVY